MCHTSHAVRPGLLLFWADSNKALASNMSRCRLSNLSGSWQLENRLSRFQEKVSRLDRIIAEHNRFSQGVKELQDWMSDAVHMLDSYCLPTSDKSVLDSRMLKLEVCIRALPLLESLSAWRDYVVLCLSEMSRCSVHGVSLHNMLIPKH